MRTKEWYGKLKPTHDVVYVPASGTSTAASVSLDTAEVPSGNAMKGQCHLIHKNLI